MSAISSNKDEIKDRNDIVDVISAVVALKRRGRNFIGLCPFHQEKTPSFNVDPVNRSYHCFGCGEGGDVVKFVERHENMSFVEAMRFLARRVGLTFESSSSSEDGQSKREQLFEVNAIAADWFQRMLNRTSEASTFLEKRGLIPDTIRKFRLGSAPDGWDGMVGFLQSRKVDLSVAETAGLIKKGSASNYFDMFRHRIIFPIADEMDRIVGFGGRAFGDEPPKYLNTGETPIFVKNRLLYGLPFARKRIGEKQDVLLMEGYMDVIVAHQAGFTNAIATLGTSLTEEHARKISKLMAENPTATLVYDGDGAGIKATLRASELLESEGVRVHIASLPQGEDPDSIIKKSGIAAFQSCLDRSVGRVEYQLDRIVATSDASTADGKAKMLSKLLYILATVGTRVERDVYMERIWTHHPMASHGPSVAKEQMHRDSEAIRIELKRKSQTTKKSGTSLLDPSNISNPQLNNTNQGSNSNGKASKSGSAEMPPLAIIGATREQRAEWQVIRGLVCPASRSWVLTHAKSDIFSEPAFAAFFEWCLRQERKGRDIGESPVRVWQSESEDPGSNVLFNQLQEIDRVMANEPINEDVLSECLKVLFMGKLRQARAEWRALLVGRELNDDDRERIDQLNQIILRLSEGMTTQA